MSDDAPASRNFIEQIIDGDLASGKHNHVVTRFPPEPNGFLHIGHAKSICLNYGLSQQYDGTFHLRFDDTNPVKEDDTYVQAIKADVEWLGAKWEDKLFNASDYYDRLYDCAEELVRRGKAYVCDLSAAEMNENRGGPTDVGVPSPWRDRRRSKPGSRGGSGASIPLRASPRPGLRRPGAPACASRWVR